MKIINKVLESLNEEVLRKLELSKIINHPAESGRSREQIITQYLEHILPKSVKLGTGFVIDAQGNTSKQIDVLVYQDEYHPVITVGNVNYYMVESVVAVIEVKASISDKKTLRQALENIKSVKNLDRTNRNSNYLVSGNKNKGKNVDANNFYHQVFGAILTESSLSSTNLAEQFQQYFQDNPSMSLWPNMYVDVRGASLRYIKQTDDDSNVTAVPRDATGYIITNPDAENYAPPLLELTYELLNFIRVAPQVDYSPNDYFYLETGEADIARNIPDLVKLLDKVV